MRRSVLVHRFLPEGTTGDTGFATLVDAGYVVALGPGLVAGTPLFNRLLDRLEAAVLEVAEGFGVQRAHLPASEGEALVNLLAHLGWAGARQGLAALGTGFREMTVEPDGLHGLALYRRLDMVRLEGGTASDESPVAGDLVAAILAALGGLGVPEPTWDGAENGAENETGDATGAGAGALQSQGVTFGQAVRRPLAQAAPESVEGAEQKPAARTPGEQPTDGAASTSPTAEAPTDALLLLELDLFSVAGVLAEHHRDERGLSWPVACAPYLVALVEAAGENAVAHETSVKLEAELQAAGLSVLRDDTGEQAATQRRAAERLGIPFRILCGPTCGEGVVVLECRAGGTPERVPVAEVLAWLQRRAGDGAGPGSPGRSRRMRALY